MKLDNAEVIDNWSSQDPGETFFSLGSAPRQCSLTLEKGRSYKLSVEYQWSGRFPAVQFGMLAPDPHNFIDEAVNLASGSDVVVLMVGTNSDWETEGYDRTNLNLPSNQNELITKICKVNPNTVVVMNTGSPCTMPWHDDAKAILQCWFPGQEFGNSLSDILFGEVNPSGKLPTTFPRDIKDTPIFNHYPGKDLQMDYLEGLYIGYRWYEKEGIEPLFPFGHGLSYTNFQYQDLRVVPPKGNGTAVAFEIKVTNTGAVKGKEIIQCYIGTNSSQIERPLKELKAFSKIELEPLETRTVLFELTERDLSYWDEGSNQWKIEPSEYKVSVGASSKDIREEVSVWLG